VLLGGMDVSHLIRTQEVAEAASKVAVFPKVRSALLQLQQDFGKNDGLIADGRDMGTVVFPNAQVTRVRKNVQKDAINSCKIRELMVTLHRF